MSQSFKAPSAKAPMDDAVLLVVRLFGLKKILGFLQVTF